MTNFENNIFSLYGEEGKAWLEALPKQVAHLAKQYALSGLTPVNNLSYNYVLSGFQKQLPIILKLSLDCEGLKQEARVLKAFSGFGSVQVLAENKGMLLLERALPGTALKTYFPDRENEGLSIICGVIKKLNQAPLPEAGKFPHIHDWLMALDKPWEIPTDLLDKAKRLRDALLATSAKTLLLHGDLHHDNILQSRRSSQSEDGWVIIDPKGVIGEPAFETAAYIRNPIPDLLSQDNAIDIIKNRIIVMSSKLDIPAKRILDWCFVAAVLSWTWNLEDNLDVSYFKNLTTLFHNTFI